MPARADGKRVCERLVPKKNGKEHEALGGHFEFFYQGWKNDGEQYRHGATRENLFPEERKGKLCCSTLIRLGLTTNRMKEEDGAPDALFFYQLLLPIVNPTRSGIEHDPRMGFYHKATQWSNTYAVRDLDSGNGYGHDYKTTSPDELVRWDGIIVTDGVLGGSRGAILRRFDDSRENNLCYSKHIGDSFTKTRFVNLREFTNSVIICLHHRKERTDTIQPTKTTTSSRRCVTM